MYDSISNIIFVTNCGNFVATKRFKINTIFTWKSIAASITFLVWCLFEDVLICILEKNKPKILI